MTTAERLLLDGDYLDSIGEARRTSKDLGALITELQIKASKGFGFDEDIVSCLIRCAKKEHEHLELCLAGTWELLKRSPTG